jgi:hypothetical protein
MPKIWNLTEWKRWKEWRLIADERLMTE